MTSPAHGRHAPSMAGSSKTGGRRGTNGVAIKGHAARAARQPEQQDAMTVAQIAYLSERNTQGEGAGSPAGPDAHHALPWLALLALACGALALVLVLMLVVL